MTTSSCCGTSFCRCSGDDEPEDDDGEEEGESETIRVPKEEDSVTLGFGKDPVEGAEEAGAAADELEAVVSTG